MDEAIYRRGAQLLSMIDRVGRSYADSFLKEKGVSRGQVPYLMELYHHAGVSQDFLAQKAAMDKSTAARAIQKLEAAGLVRREQNPQDKRENLVYLTEAGRQIHPYVKQLMSQWIQLVTEEVSEEEMRVLVDILERMGERAQAYRRGNLELEKQES